ncbi:hypothetical protein E8E14_013516 [Neopestalotiopsis sp. 37M]|nr:hypothetical protein E8E14_013516 [Neopestalotiopsis sp. 37M]
MDFDLKRLYNQERTVWDFVAVIILLLVPNIIILFTWKWNSALPLVNPKRSYEVTSSRAVREFTTSAKDIIYTAVKRFGSRPFRVISDFGEVVILRPQQGDEIRNDKRFSFTGQLETMFQANLPGFEPYRMAASADEPLQVLVRSMITRNLAELVTPLSNECTAVLEELLHDSEEWIEVNLKDLIVKVITRMSSRIFVGDTLCRDQEWLDLVVKYGFASAHAAEQLRVLPSALRPFAVRLLPSCVELRAQVDQAEKYVARVLAARESSSSGVQYMDAIAGFKEIAKSKSYDAGASQLMLSVVAIMTTADLVTGVMTDLLEHPDMIEPLRNEISAVIGTEGLNKASLSKLELVDSVLKESQRLKPAQIALMHRRVMEDVQLKDGTELRAGSNVAVSAERMWDSTVHEDPDIFDGYRYYNMRRNGKAAGCQLVNTSIDHMGFGHGRHACPGRFFAADESKIILSHLLLKYDWKMSSEQKPVQRIFGFFSSPDDTIKAAMKRRQEEVALP